MRVEGKGVSPTISIVNINIALNNKGLRVALTIRYGKHILLHKAKGRMTRTRDQEEPSRVSFYVATV